jgi:hypothetical protein
MMDIKKMGLISLLLCVWIHFAQAQFVTGRVLRFGTTEPIAKASVYISNSMKGTTSNAVGAFSLRVDNNKIPIVVSCIGYYSETVTAFSAGKPVVVYLKAKENTMHVVQIGTEGLEKMRIFRREFLGTSDIARSCIITNEADIELKYTKGKRVLTAECSNPIVVQNPKLGYTIQYFLDKFEYTKAKTTYIGNYLFTETSNTQSLNEEKEIAKRREEVYVLSRMFFIRSLWNDRLEEAGMEIFNSEFDAIPIHKTLYVDSLRNKYIKPYSLHVCYYGDYKHFTDILKETEFAYIDKNGFYDPNILWGGLMGSQRVGDMLPFEYKSKFDVIGYKRRKKHQVMIDLKKIGLISLLLCSLIQLVQAQHFTDKQTDDFRAIALQPVNPLDTTLIIRKWAEPIYYHVYGSESVVFDHIVLHVTDTTFLQLRELTNLQIEKSDDNDLINFRIIIGNPDKYARLIPPDAVEYFKRHTGNQSYFTNNADGINGVVLVLDPKLYITKAPLQTIVQVQLALSIGLMGRIDVYQNASLFDRHPAVLPSKFSEDDARVIKTLYNSLIHFGMNTDEVNAVLLKINKQAP